MATKLHSQATTQAKPLKGSSGPGNGKKRNVSATTAGCRPKKRIIQGIARMVSPPAATIIQDDVKP